ncbi:MAG: flagellar basal-body rod protein FlgB [Clostridia bacterium]|nr:flagellar basal-body rod protein FlgB [Clostridia bacterium]
MLFFTPTLLALEKALQTASLRQRTLAHNIANANTPGFKRSYVSFEEELRAALNLDPGLPLARTHPRHLPYPRSLADVRPEVRQDLYTAMRQDGNNVDIDREMVELAMNSINYSAAVQQLNQRLAMLRYVINEGRR